MSNRQALSFSQGTYVQVENSANGLRNVFSDPAMHLNVLYSTGQTPYKANISCPSGSTNVNNECLVPGSASGVPFRLSTPAMTSNNFNSLFSPIDYNQPPMSAAAASLMQERGPCPASAYQLLDSNPLRGPGCQ